jgi:hypothetical protein
MGSPAPKSSTPATKTGTSDTRPVGTRLILQCMPVICCPPRPAALFIINSMNTPLATTPESPLDQSGSQFATKAVGRSNRGQICLFSVAFYFHWCVFNETSLLAAA